jgi:leader peptidase (prepilin peptidase)/N-methyltransferase
VSSADALVMIVATAALMGVTIGSFVNLVIDRLPRMLERQWAEEMLAETVSGTGLPQSQTDPPEPTPEAAGPATTPMPSRHTADQPQGPSQSPSPLPRFDLAWPPSRCDHCLTRLTWHDLIPVIGWLMLRGRCRHCGAAIGRRSLLVEITLGALFGLAAWRFAIGIELVGACLLLGFLLAAAVIDFETRLLPDALTQPLVWLGLLFNLGACFAPLDSAVIGAVCGYSSLWTVNAIYHRIAGRQGMGQGDFKLLAAIGAWLGWQALPFVLILGSLAGALFGVTMMLRERSRRGQPIAFGPWLALGVLPVLFGLMPAGAS